MRAYERLLQYVRYHTTSDENAPEDKCPTTDRQKVLGAALAEELRGLGLADAHMDECGYVYGTLPANCETDRPVLGLIAHMDTAPAVSGENVRARIVENYDGGDIVLNAEKNIVMRPAEFESLLDYKGQDLIVTDGTTLLGSDDKAGIAEIFTTLERLVAENIPHGTIKVGITPDEETGRGADRFDVKGFGAQYAYTVDGGKLGEIEYENFNAADAKITINGVSVHPGTAKGKMKNAILIAMEFHSMLPVFENPAFTEGYEGFSHLEGIQGHEEQASLHYIIRDHDMEKFEAKKARFQKIADYLNDKYGAGTVVLNLTDTYYNMKQQIAPHMFLIEDAEQAMRDAGVEPLVVPIRGGTDGARLSFMGLPCPNLSTGGHNFHGRFEYIPVQSMDKMVEVLLNLVRV